MDLAINRYNVKDSLLYHSLLVWISYFLSRGNSDTSSKWYGYNSTPYSYLTSTHIVLTTCHCSVFFTNINSFNSLNNCHETHYLIYVHGADTVLCHHQNGHILPKSPSQSSFMRCRSFYISLALFFCNRYEILTIYCFVLFWKSKHYYSQISLI